MGPEIYRPFSSHAYFRFLSQTCFFLSKCQRRTSLTRALFSKLGKILNMNLDFCIISKKQTYVFQPVFNYGHSNDFFLLAFFKYQDCPLFKVMARFQPPLHGANFRESLVVLCHFEDAGKRNEENI